MIKKIAFVFVAILTINVFLDFLLQYIAVNSESYEAAKKYLREDGRVSSVYGKDAAYTLVPLHFNSRSSGDSGSAEFLINVDGELHSGQVHVELEKSVEWKLVEIQIVE